MVKNLVDFFITDSFLLPQFLGFVVGLLQLLQPKPHTINTGFIRLLIGELNSESTPETLKLWQSIGSIDEDLMLRRKARKRGTETWNWRVCWWRLQTMKDLSVFSLKISFFFIILLKKTRQSVYSSVCFDLIIIYSKMIARKLLSPADLART